MILARGLKDELTATKGAIVNVTSIAGVRVHPFAGAAYSTSKAALAALTREMAHDFGPLGVRVNAIAPGEVETSILSPGTDKIVEGLPLRRLGQPSEVADVIWFLCSDASSYVTGTEDGGERGPARLNAAGHAIVAMIARSVSIPSPFSDDVTTIPDRPPDASARHPAPAPAPPRDPMILILSAFVSTA